MCLKLGNSYSPPRTTGELAQEGTGLGARIYSKSIKLGWYWMDREYLMQCLAEGERHDGAIGGV